MSYTPGGAARAVLTPLRSAWEDTVSAGLRQATDVELLWMLDEIEAQLGERDAPWGVRPAGADDFDDIPDWDDKTPEELEAIARELEADEPEPDPLRHGPPHPRPFRRRGRPDKPATLRCEELEPRYPPAGLALPAAPALAPALASTVWVEDPTPTPCPSGGPHAAFAACDDEVVDGLTYALVA